MPHKIVDKSPIEYWEVVVRLSDAHLARFLRVVIECDTQIFRTWRAWANYYENSNTKGWEGVQILVGIPRDSVSKFKEIWKEKLWYHPVVSIPVNRLQIHDSQFKRKLASKHGSLPHWTP